MTIVSEKSIVLPFSHYKVWEKNLCSRANNSKVNNPIVRAFMPVLITCKHDKDPVKGD